MQGEIVILGGGAIGSALAELMTTTHDNVNCTVTYAHNRPTINAPRIDLVQLDPLNEKDFESLNERVASKGKTLRMVINTIGMLHDNVNNITPEKRLADFNPEAFNRVMNVNVIPTIYAAKHLAPLFNPEGTSYFAAISAKVGSIEDNRLGGWMSYRASKAALNMAIKNISIELARKHKNLCVLALHPGTTQSNLSAPFADNVPVNKLFSPSKTARYLLSVIEKCQPQDTGKFFGWDSSVIPW